MKTKNLEKHFNKVYDNWSDFNKPKHSFKIESENQILFYFGGNHSFDPDNEQYKRLKNYWNKFLQQSQGKRVVFVEGGKRPVRKSIEEAVKKDTEAGYITYIAHKEEISIVSPDPERDEEVKYLSDKFPVDYINYYYFARQTYQWNKMKSKNNFKEYMRMFSIDKMKAVHKDLFGTDFDKNNEEFFKKVINPIEGNSIINDIARACSVFRNVYITSKTKEYWDKDFNIFIVFGNSHAVSHEKIFRKILN